MQIQNGTNVRKINNSAERKIAWESIYMLMVLGYTCV
jgi:hypothetical protein